MLVTLRMQGAWVPGQVPCAVPRTDYALIVFVEGSLITAEERTLTCWEIMGLPREGRSQRGDTGALFCLLPETLGMAVKVGDKGIWIKAL